MNSTIIILLKASLFYIVPILIGAGLSIFTLFKKDQIEEGEEEAIEPHTLERKVIRFIELFVRGALLIFVQTFIVKNFSSTQNFLNNLQIVIFAESIFGILVLIALSIKKIRKTKLMLVEIGIFLFLILISIVGYKAWSKTSDLNSVINWDMFMHQATVYEISKGRLDINTKNISDTYNFYSYTPLFHTVVLASQVFELPKDVGVANFWWGAQYFHYLVTIFVSYTLAKQLSKNRGIGVLSAILGAFVFESIMAYTSLVLIPQTLVGTMFIGKLAGMANRRNSNKIITLNEFFLITFVAAGHFIIGVGALAIMVFNKIYWLVEQKFSKKEAFQLIVLILSILSIPLFYFVTTQVDLGAMNRGEGAAFSLPVGLKMEYLQTFYGYLIWLMLPIGTLFAFKEHKNSKTTFAISLAFITLAVVFTNIPYILKYYVIARYFVHFLLAYGIFKLIENVNGVFKTFTTALLVAVMFIVFGANSLSYKDSFTYDQMASHIKEEELEAARFLNNNNYGNTTGILLVSDPTTMHIMEGVTGINTAGGAFSSENTRKIVSKIWTSRDTRNMNRQLFKTKDRVNKAQVSKIILVISGRFSNWQKAEESQKLGVVFNSWQPKDLTFQDYEFIDFLNKSDGFKQIYNTEGVVVYEVSQ